MSELQEQLARVRAKIYDREENKTAYMSDMKNWLCVHTTKYEPQTLEDGTKSIQTTAMVTNDELPRATVHVTLNQVVASNGGGNWDSASIVILAPYEDVVSLNGQPQEVATEDTYFIADPDKGLVLPKNTYIVRGSPECHQLFEIGENEATYKTDHFSDEEINEILSLDQNAKYKYEQCLNPNVSDNIATEFLDYNPKLIEIYKKSKDKAAFLKGILEEDRYAILNKILRNAVVKMSMEKIGHHYILSHEDNVSKKVDEVARSQGMRGNSGNKGHSLSPEAALEDVGCALTGLADVLKSLNADQIFEALTNPSVTMGKEIMGSILNDEPLCDVSKIYERTFNDYIDDQISIISCDGYYTESEKQTEMKPFEVMKQGGLQGYNTRLDQVLKRHAKKMNESYANSLQKLKQNPKEYAKLQNRLRDFEASRTQNSQKRNNDCVR